MARLVIWVPTNRWDSRLRYIHVDGWNELVAANRKGAKVGARVERENVIHVAQWARVAMRKAKWEPMTRRTAKPCRVTLTFVERDRRRDVGNIHGGSKYALDGLTARHPHGAGAIYDDSQRWLPEVEYRVEVVSESHREPGIEITIETLEEE